jgi:hypothetical protein
VVIGLPHGPRDVPGLFLPGPELDQSSYEAQPITGFERPTIKVVAGKFFPLAV